jgi:hypothetical protein
LCSGKREGLLLAALAVVLLGSGCAKSRYVIKGLRLPPGAEEVDFSETKSGKYTSITSTFNYSGDWDAVVAHFDRVLGQAGYHAESNPMGDAASVPGLGDLDFGSMMRMYSKEGSDYGVQLTNTSGMMAAMGGAARDAAKGGFGGTGDYTLTVMHVPGASAGS